MKLKLQTVENSYVQNLLDNGDFQCWQRGESFTIVGDEAFHYTADCWCVYASTGQTIAVKKTTDGLQFSGTGAIMQRIPPLKVGAKYTFLCRVDNDVKTLQITGGSYTENSFLKYNKSGAYEQLQIKSNGNTKVGNARLWKGTTVYAIIEEDKSISLLRCRKKLYAREIQLAYYYTTSGYDYYKALVDNDFDDKVTISIPSGKVGVPFKGDVKFEQISGGEDTGQFAVLVSSVLTNKFPLIYAYVEISCEPK